MLLDTSCATLAYSQKESSTPRLSCGQLAIVIVGTVLAVGIAMILL